MRNLYFAAVALFLAPLSVTAQTTLYACVKDGKTTLESTAQENCDKLTKYEYPSYNTQEKSGKSPGLRAEEIRQLESPPMPYGPVSQIRRYENVDERIGYADLNSYMDSNQDKCAAYRRQLESALFYIEAKNNMMIEIGPFRSAELQAQINQAQPQVDYYCR